MKASRLDRRWVRVALACAVLGACASTDATVGVSPGGKADAAAAGGARVDGSSSDALAPTGDAAPSLDVPTPAADAAPDSTDGRPRADVADDAIPQTPPDGALAGDAGPTPDLGPSPDDLAFQARLFGAEIVIPVTITLPEASEAALRADPHADYVAADLTIDGVDLPQVGLRLKGGRGSFRALGQKAAFKIDVNHFVPRRRFAGLSKLTFNNMIQDTTQMRERLGSLMFTALGLPAGRVGYVEISVNGTNYGLYSHIETLDERFLERAFPGDADGNLYEGFDDLDLWLRDVAAFDQDAGDDDDEKADLRTLVRALDGATPPTFEAAVGPAVDLDRMRRFFAAEILTGHWDGYAQLRNNYYLYRRPSDDRFVFLPSGMDQAFTRTNNPYAGPARLFRMCVDWLPCRLPYAEAIREGAATLATTDWRPEIDRLAALLEEPFSRDRKTPTRPEQRLLDIDALRTWVVDHPIRMAGALSCLDPGQDGDGDLTLPCAGDCDDDDATVYPGADDTCGDERDQDCTGFTDDGQDCPMCRAVPVPGRETEFLICHRPVRFSVAETLCVDQGATFASIHDETEQAALATAAAARRRTRWWIGGLDTGTPGMFRWRDGTPWDFDAWADDQPDNAGGYEHCTAMNAQSDGRWADYYSGFYQPFICRR
ncbi:CotH kinase family protein [Myxococcota bacterium]|nr:CotH kinase family protein [Myxococcota bacterium]